MHIPIQNSIKRYTQVKGFVNIAGSPIVNGAGKHRWGAESATEAIGLLQGTRRGLSNAALASLCASGGALASSSRHYKDFIALTFLGTIYTQNNFFAKEGNYAKN